MARISCSGPAWPAWLKVAVARFRCRPGRGHIVAAARLQLVGIGIDARYTRVRKKNNTAHITRMTLLNRKH